MAEIKTSKLKMPDGNVLVFSDSSASRDLEHILDNDIDLNTVTESGFYRLQDSYKNGPSNCNNGQMLVVHGGSDTISQFAMPYSSSIVYVRNGNTVNNANGTWHNWVNLTDNDNTTYSAGIGISISGTTIKVNLNSNVTGKNYPVKVDGSNKLYVSVPWQNDNTTYSLGRSGSTLYLYDQNGSWHGFTSLTSDLYWANLSIKSFSDTGTEPTFKNATATDHFTATYYIATSDRRLKENLKPFESKKSILDLPIYKFDFINGKKGNIGCMAQDLQEICPEIVSEREDGYLAIEENKIVYLLLDEIKKLKKEIEVLRGER